MKYMVFNISTISVTIRRVGVVRYNYYERKKQECLSYK